MILRNDSLGALEISKKKQRQKLINLQKSLVLFNVRIRIATIWVETNWYCSPFLHCFPLLTMPTPLSKFETCNEYFLTSIRMKQSWIMEPIWTFFPESDREGFFWEKHYHQRLPKWWLSWKIVTKTCEVITVYRDCHQRLPKWSLSLKIVIKDCRSDGCLERLSSKTAEVMAVLKDCHQRLPKWWLSWKTVIKDYRSDGCL